MAAHLVLPQNAFCFATAPSSTPARPSAVRQNSGGSHSLPSPASSRGALNFRARCPDHSPAIPTVQLAACHSPTARPRAFQTVAVSRSSWLPSLSSSTSTPGHRSSRSLPATWRPASRQSVSTCRASAGSSEASEEGSFQTGSSRDTPSQSTAPSKAARRRVPAVDQPVAAAPGVIPKLSYYPRGYEFLEDEELPDWRPYYWALAGVVSIWSFRHLIAAEIAKWPHYIEVGSVWGSKGVDALTYWAAQLLVSIFGKAGQNVLTFFDIAVTFLAQNFSMLVKLMPATPTIASLLLVSFLVSIADVAVVPTEKPVLERMFLPAGILSLAFGFRLLAFKNFFIGLALLMSATSLAARPSPLTVVTPAVAAIMVTANSWVLKGGLLGLYIALAVFTKWERESKGGGEGKRSWITKQDRLKQPLLLKAATFVVGAVLLRRWVGSLLVLWLLV